MLVDRPIAAVSGDLPRKWLFDDALELIVWYSAPDRIYGFQLIYDLRDAPKVFAWTLEQGCTHHLVDCGNDNPSKDQISILGAATKRDPRLILSLFEMHSLLLPAEIRNLVIHHLRSCSNVN